MERTPETVADALKFNILFRRAQMRLSQDALAKRADVPLRIVSDLEFGCGNATLNVLVRIACALEISVADLLTQHVQPGNSDADIERRAADGDESYVSARDLLGALDDVGNTVRSYGNDASKTVRCYGNGR